MSKAKQNPNKTRKGKQSELATLCLQIITCIQAQTSATHALMEKILNKLHGMSDSLDIIAGGDKKQTEQDG